MKISVIIPTYNREKFIEKAINSVLAQSVKPYEVIIIDDGSTDETFNLLKKYKNKIKLLTQKNTGVSSARNLGIKVADGEWIALLDSDDIWLKHKLSTQIKYHKENPRIEISQTNEEWIRDGKVFKQPKKYIKKSGFIFSDLLTHSTISPSTTLIKKSIFDDIGYFDENLIVCEDYDLWLRIALKYEFGLIEDSLILKYGGHFDQLSTTIWGMNRFRVQALEKHINSLHKDEVLKILIKKCEILAKGAMKRDNREIYEIYNTKVKNYKDMLSQLIVN